MKNENKKLSRNRKRRIERKKKLDEQMKSLLNKNKSKKKKKKEIIDKAEEVEIELVRINYANNPNKIQSEIKDLKKFTLLIKIDMRLNEKEIVDYTGEFEMVGELSIADHNRQTHIRFRNITEYESYINAIDQDYESEGAIFNGHIYKIDTPQFNTVNRSQCGNGCDFKHESIEYQVNNCFIPTKGYCFVNYINFLTGGDYKQQVLDFIRNEQRRSNNMTKARVQPFCRANIINLGYYDGRSVFPRSFTEKNDILFLFNNHLVCYGNLKVSVLIKLYEN